MLLNVHQISSLNTHSSDADSTDDRQHGDWNVVVPATSEKGYWLRVRSRRGSHNGARMGHS